MLDDSIAPCRFWGWREAHCLGASGAIRPKRPLGQQLPCRTPCMSSRSSTSTCHQSQVDTLYFFMVCSQHFALLWYLLRYSLLSTAQGTLQYHYAQVLRTCLFPRPHFNAKHTISSVLIPNADTKIPEIQSDTQAVRKLHAQSSCLDKALSGDAWASAQIHLPAPREAGISDLVSFHPAVDPSSRKEDGSTPSHAACTWSGSHTWLHAFSRP